MIKHGKLEFDDMRFRPLELTRRAINNFNNNECEIIIVSGMPEGVGKSNYVNHAVADFAGFQACKEYDKVKYMWMNCGERRAKFPEAKIWEADYAKVMDYTKYLPRDVVKMCMSMIDQKRKVPMWHWDDGGTHLASMEWTDPFVKAFMEFLPLARSICGLVVISTPVEEWVLKKLHTSGGVLHAPVVKMQGNEGNPFRLRSCTVYKRVKNLKLNRSFNKNLWADNFTAIVPDDFYAIYKPVRDHYAKLALDKMQNSLAKREASLADESAIETIREDIEDANNIAPELREVVAQVR